MRKIAIAIAAAAGLLLQANAAQAAEIKVLSAGIMQRAVDEIAKGFERLYGDKLALTYASAEAVKTQLLKGERTDVAITTQADMAALVKARKIVGSTVQPVARTTLGIAVKKGQPKPDIATPAALKKALLAAKSIAYEDPKAGFEPGILFQRAVVRLGIAKQVAAKAKLLKTIPEIRGEKSADMVVAWQTTYAGSPDYDVFVPLPAQFQDAKASTFVAGAAATATDASTAADLVRVLASPESAGVFKAKGFQPPK